MLKKWKLLLAVLVLATQLSAEPIPNVIMISVDGVSRETLYALLQKNKLPNMAILLETGNYRNMSLVVDKNTNDEAFVSQITGYTKDRLLADKDTLNIPSLVTVFGRLKHEYPGKIQTVLILNQPNNDIAPVFLSPYIQNTIAYVDAYHEEKPRNVFETGRTIRAAIQKIRGPFFLYANVTDAEGIAHKYREGVSQYSQAIKDFDEQLGYIIEDLKKKREFKDTKFLITTNFGFEPVSKRYENNKESWVLSSDKILFKGTNLDLVPTILYWYGMDYEKTLPRLQGKPLVN